MRTDDPPISCLKSSHTMIPLRLPMRLRPRMATPARSTLQVWRGTLPESREECKAGGTEIQEILRFSQNLSLSTVYRMVGILAGDEGRERGISTRRCGQLRDVAAPVGSRIRANTCGSRLEPGSERRAVTRAARADGRHHVGDPSPVATWETAAPVGSTTGRSLVVSERGWRCGTTRALPDALGGRPRLSPGWGSNKNPLISGQSSGKMASISGLRRPSRGVGSDPEKSWDPAVTLWASGCLAVGRAVVHSVAGDPSP